MPTLFQFCGLPGAGKSTLAALLAKATKSVLLSHDKISASLTIHGLYRFDEEFSIRRRPTQDIVSILAGEQLRNGLDVIIDSLAENDKVRIETQKMCNSFGANFVLVYCICVEESILRDRLRNRNRKISGWEDRGEEHLDRVSPHFTTPDNPTIIVKTDSSTDESIEKILQAVRSI